MEMMLNSLPSRTWNRLGMNESFIKVEEACVSRMPEIVCEDRRVCLCGDAGEDSGFPRAEGGMGDDFADFVRDAPVTELVTPAGTVMERPALITYHYREGEAAQNRLRLHAGKNSTLSVILLMDAPSAEAAGLAAHRTEVWAEEGSRVKLYVAQLLGDGFCGLMDVAAVCEADAAVDLVKLELGAGRLYAGAKCDLPADSGAFSVDLGYYVREGRQMDMNYVAQHRGPRTTCRMDAAGTLEEGARKVFRGTIDFRRGCAGAKGAESENVLLLGDRMVNQSIPLILCKEEDVEGSHGASIGKLDDKVLFYLASRGIGEKEAQKLISKARIQAVCDKIPNEEVRRAVREFDL